MAAHEPEALVDDVEDAGRVDVAGALALALEDPVDELLAPFLRGRLDLEIAADGAQLRHAHRAQIRDVEVVALARGFELLHLVVFAYRRAADGHAATRPPIAGTRVRTVRGHGVGFTLEHHPGSRGIRSAAGAEVGWQEG